jgi:hypothetical protein
MSTQGVRRPDDRLRPECDARAERHPLEVQASRGDVLAELSGTYVVTRHPIFPDQSLHGPKAEAQRQGRQHAVIVLGIARPGLLTCGM